MVNQSDLVKGARVTLAGVIDSVEIVENDDFSYVSCCVFIDSSIGARHYVQVTESAILSAEAPAPEAPDCKHVTLDGEVVTLDPNDGSWSSGSFLFSNWYELYKYARRCNFIIQKLIPGEFI